MSAEDLDAYELLKELKRARFFNNIDNDRLHKAIRLFREQYGEEFAEELNIDDLIKEKIEEIERDENTK